MSPASVNPLPHYNTDVEQSLHLPHILPKGQSVITGYLVAGVGGLWFSLNDNWIPDKGLIRIFLSISIFTKLAFCSLYIQLCTK